MLELLEPIEWQPHGQEHKAPVVCEAGDYELYCAACFALWEAGRWQELITPIGRRRIEGGTERVRRTLEASLPQWVNEMVALTMAKKRVTRVWSPRRWMTANGFY